MSNSRQLALAALAAGLFSLTAAAGAEPAPEKQPPAGALAAAAERWKLERAAERAAQPGAAGQHDLFWEILRLWEKDEKARADADLLAVANWLLFDSGLAGDQNLADPVYGKVPALVPRLGERLLDRRLGGWIATVQAAGAAGNEPWLWADFPGMDKQALAAAVGRLIKTGPRSNPVTRVWLAAALLAAEGEKGPEELAAARAALARDLPSRAGQLDAAVVESLCRGGVRGALPLLLDQAEAALAGARPTGEIGPREFEPWRVPGPSWHLTRFHQLVGWSTRKLTAGGGVDVKAEIDSSRAWLKVNFEKLVWDARLRRFTGGAPQPGMERLQGAAEAVEKKWDLKLLDPLVSGQITAAAALGEAIALMERKPEAAKDPAVAELAMALVEDGGAVVLGERDGTYLRLSRINPELGVRFLAAGLRGQLAARNPEHLGTFLWELNASQPKAVAEACAQLAPQFEKTCAEAAKGEDRDRKLHAALACLFVGGKVEGKYLAELVDGAPPPPPGAGSRSCVVGRWAFAAVRAGRPGGLRLMLALGRKEIARYAQEGAMHPVRQFAHWAGWRDQSEAPAGTAEEELARAQAWLDKYEAGLKFDPARNRFTGAPPPGMEAVADAAAAVGKRYGLKTGDVLGSGQDEARKLFSELLELMEKNAEAAKDQQVIALALAMVEPGRMESDPAMRERLYVRLPKVSRAAGLKVWTAFLRRSLLAACGPGAGYRMAPSELVYPAARLPGLDLSIIPEAAKALAEEFGKRYAESAQTPAADRLALAVVCMYVGAKVEFGEVEKLMEEASKVGSLRVGLTSWGEAMARAGNVAGLRLVLAGAQRTPSSRAHDLGRFEYLSGRSNQEWGGGAFNLDEKAQLARIEAARKWLDENEKNLVFDPAAGRFKLGAEAPPNPPDKPKPPEMF